MNMIHEIKSIESTFFDVDRKKHAATVRMQFEKASDMFDEHFQTESPIVNDEVKSRISKAFNAIPDSCKIALSIQLGDMEDYTEESLQTIFHDNVLLDYKAMHRESRNKNRLAYCLIGVGVIFFILMMLVNSRWPEGGLVRDIFFYISDIAATVTIWEALGILLVQERENRHSRRNLASRFGSISFSQKQERN